MKILALTIGNITFTSPANVPTGGINEVWSIGRTIIEVLFLSAIILCIFFLVLNGFRWVMSEGEKERVQKARDGITFAVLGLIIVLISFFLVNIVATFFNIDLLGIGLLK